jgi:glutathione S-transferase
MSNVYRVFGAELSPYSVKVRSYFRYKKIPHEWVVRHVGNMAEFQQHAKLPLIPLVLTPDGRAAQDSTPIIENLEQTFPTPSIHPPDPSSAFLSALIEEYADEWSNKPMFHYRWYYEADQESAADRLARDNLPGAPEDAITKTAASIRERMVPRLSFVGSSPETKDVIELSFQRQLAILDPHLATRPYLFGRRPVLADFGLAMQLYECSTDPTPARIMTASAPNVLTWIQRMLNPTNDGDLESWEALAPTLEPLLTQEVGGIFLPWSTANAEALAAGERTLSVELNGVRFTQDTQKYHAKSLGALRARYAAVENKTALDPVLERTGCRKWLT